MGHRVIAILFQTRGHPHLKRDLCRFVIIANQLYYSSVEPAHLSTEWRRNMIEKLIAFYIIYIQHEVNISFIYTMDRIISILSSSVMDSGRSFLFSVLVVFVVRILVVVDVRGGSG